MSNSFFERANPPPRRKTCVACTKAKRRCDHDQPSCLRCARRKIDCVYPSQSATRSKVRAAEGPPQSILTLPSKENLDTVAESTVQDHTEQSVCLYNSVVPWSQDPDVLPLGLDVLDDMTFDIEFDDLINHDALIDEALSVPVSMSSIPDQLSVPAQRRPPQTSLEEIIASRLQFALDTIKRVPSLMVLENQAPWSHPYLYQPNMPRDMQDAQACCALYIAKNRHNSSTALRTIQARAHEVMASPLPKERLDILARIQAVLLYQIIRLFDGDIPLRASAQQSLSVLESALIALVPFVKWNRAQPATGPDEDTTLCPTKDFFHEWIFQESARRTLFFSCFFLVAHRMLVGLELPGGCTERYVFCESWTLSAHLWKASNVVEFAVAWTEKRHFVINNQSFTEVLRDASADDVDLFGRILMSGALGIEETRLWFYNRGGAL